MEISLIDAAANGFLNILQLKVFLAMLVGVSIGTFTAVAPQGLGIPLVYAIMLPVVIKWEPLTGIALLIGASSVSAIIWGLFEYTLEIRWRYAGLRDFYSATNQAAENRSMRNWRISIR